MSNVSWEDCVAYCTWLSQEAGAVYRLPSEAEWEYAARAGTKTAFWWGDDIDANRANYGSKQGKTLPVDAYQPNPFGLYQVYGNVWEWVQDSWHENYKGAPTDGSAWKKAGGGLCVQRGGSWYDEPSWVRGAARGKNNPLLRFMNNGFRLTRA